VKALRFIGRSVAQAALSAVILVGGIAVASNVTSSPSKLIGLVTGDRLTLTSTSGTALTANAQGNGGGIVGNAGGGTGYGVQGTSTSGGSGIGVHAVNTSGGYAFAIQTDATSPVRGALNISTQDTAPTTCIIGDLYMTSAGKLRACTATNAWTTVGDQTGL
jgi:hypothetical protein